jgi:hypothetical protein
MHRIVQRSARRLLLTALLAATLPTTAASAASAAGAHASRRHPARAARCVRARRRACKAARKRSGHATASSIGSRAPHPPLRRPPSAPSPTPPGAPETPASPSPNAPGEAVAEVPAGEAPLLSITGTTYYVSPTGSDSNSGTSPSSAWRTVKRVNGARLSPGDGVLFEGGATFSDDVLMPEASGAAGAPIVFGSYGQGEASLPLGVWFKGDDYLAFEHLTITGPESYLQGTGEGITVEWCSIGEDSLPLNAMGSQWTIDDNTINDAGNSGMLLEGEDFTVSHNTITNTGLDAAIPYGKHGIYLKVANATVTDNTITNFSADGISARYRNSVIEGNQISGGPIGIAWFQYDSIPGTSYWIGNTITDTTAAGIYVSPSDEVGGDTRESFLIEHDTIEPSAGVFMNLEPTTGTYTTFENTLL